MWKFAAQMAKTRSSKLLYLRIKQLVLQSFGSVESEDVVIIGVKASIFVQHQINVGGMDKMEETEIEDLVDE